MNVADARTHARSWMVGYLRKHIPLGEGWCWFRGKFKTEDGIVFYEDTGEMTFEQVRKATE